MSGQRVFPQAGCEARTKGQVYEKPVFVKYKNNPVFVRNDSEWLTSKGYRLMWPWIINAEAVLGEKALDRFYMYYSTDHAPDKGGIGLAVSPDLFSWTDIGLIYYDTVAGGHTETPCVVYNEDTRLFHLYYHCCLAGGVGMQSTLLATSADGRTNWTRVGIVLDIVENEFSGDGHTGNARVYKVGNRWFAVHLLGGGDCARYGVSYSNEGINWQVDPRPIYGGFTDVTEDGINRRIGLSNLTPFLFRGQMWAIWRTSSFTSGIGFGAGELYVAPFIDIRKPFGLSLALEASSSGWDSSEINEPFIIEYVGRLYLFYRSSGTDGKGAFGIAIAEVNE